MSKFIEAIETLKRWIGMDKRSGESRRKKKPRKRKYEKRKAGIKSDRRKYALAMSTSFVLLLSASIDDVYGEGIRDVPNLYEKANEHFMNGEYHEAIEIYDKILEISPTNAKTSLMKGIALDNLERYKASILEFYKVNQQEPENITKNLEGLTPEESAKSKCQSTCN